MKPTHAIGRRGVMAALLAAAAAGFCGASRADEASDLADAVRADTAWLAGFESRVVGSAGAQQASAGLVSKVQAALTDAGMSAEEAEQHVWVHRFPVVMPVYRDAKLTLTEAGRPVEHRVYPLWPGLVRLNTTPAEGISGRLIYVGLARQEDLPAVSLRGQIAVMEFCGGGGWKNAFNAGARAIILLGYDAHLPHAATRPANEPPLHEMSFADASANLTRLPMNVPRFYVPDGPLAERLRQGRADSRDTPVGRLDAQGEWVQKTATNIYALVLPRPYQKHERAIAAGAAYDSMSIVPQLAPGADAAVDAAVLLNSLRHFAKNRPARPLLFAFVDAYAINQLGVREMLATLAVGWRDQTRERHRADDWTLREEYRQYADLLADLRKRARESGGGAGAEEGIVHEYGYIPLHRFIKDEVARAVVSVEAVLYPARLLASEMDREQQKGNPIDVTDPQELIDAVDQRKGFLADYKQLLDAEQDPQVKQGMQELYGQESKSLADLQKLAEDKQYGPLKLALTNLDVEELARLRSELLAARSRLLSADPIKLRPPDRFLWTRLVNVLEQQLGETDESIGERAPLASWLWGRVRQRVEEQFAEAQRRYDLQLGRDHMQAEVLQRLGLIERLEPPASGDRKDLPISFLIGLDLSDGGVAVGPRMYCDYLGVIETSNLKSFSRWLDRFRRDKKLDTVWSADELAAVDLEPFAGQDHASSHNVEPEANFTSPAVSFAVPAVTWATLDCLRRRCDTPRDRAEELDWSRLDPQVKATFALLKRMAGQTDFEISGNPTAKWSRVRAVMVDQSPGEPVPNVPMGGYLTTLLSGSVRGGRTGFNGRAYCPAMRVDEFGFTGPDGMVYFDALPAQVTAVAKTFVVQSYRIAGDGSIIRAVDANKVGKGVRLDVTADEPNPSPRRAVVFTCREFNLLEMFDPRFLLYLPGGSVLDARRASKPQRMNLAMASGQISCLLEPGTKWQMILRAGTTQNRMTLLGISDKDLGGNLSTGELMRRGGFELGQQLPDIPMEVAVRDIYRLDELRLAAFKKAGIASEQIERIHARTGRTLGRTTAEPPPADAAAAGPAVATIAEAKQADDGAALYRAAGDALANEIRAYQAVQDTANDVARAAIFLLLALAPFSFAMERLVFASSHVYRQIGGMALIFAIMTAILWSFHPAFQLSSQPMMIIMAFGIIFMSLLVISIVYRKFESSLEEMRSGRAESSGARTSRGGLAASAIRLGIANMRKRKLRTALTGITVVLITFALLCFTSVSSYVDKREQSLDASIHSPYTGILIRQPMSRAMPQEALDYTRNVMQRTAEAIVPRMWWCHTAEPQWRLHVRDGRTAAQKKLADDLRFEEAKRQRELERQKDPRLPELTEKDRERYDTPWQTSLIGALGLDPDEAKLTAVADYLPDWDRFAAGGGCYLSQDAAEKLNVKPGARIVVGGCDLTLIGLFSTRNAQGRIAKDFALGVRGMTGESLVPTNYSQLGEEQRTLARQNNLDQLAQEMESGGGLEPDQDLPRLRSDEMIILPADMLTWGISNCSLRSIAVKTPDANAAAVEMAGRVAFPVYYGTAGGGVKVRASTPLSAVAPKSLWIVLIIAGLIIFNTMLNSIAERKKEIHIYTSLGLSPLHVGVLFLAEAMTYGLMGSIFGYIVGQGAATLLAHLNLMGGITLNYSGTQAIATMLMVMIIVVVSSLVPALMAGKLAAPSAEMKWRVPRPVDGVIRDTLPFTVTRQTANGVAMFLYEYMDAHREGSIGHFSTDNLRTFTAKAGEAGEVLGIEGTVWLAPYDLGVRQGVSLLIHPTPDEEVFEIDVSLTREAGQPGSWQKLNKVFLGDLRRQLLGWRKLKTKRILEYIAAGAEVLARGGGDLTQLPGLMGVKAEQAVPAVAAALGVPGAAGPGPLEPDGSSRGDAADRQLEDASAADDRAPTSDSADHPKDP